MTAAHSTATLLAERITAADGSEITIRQLTSNEDCRACVDLQREIWGFDIGDIVPASLVHVVSFVGGLAAGAFDASGTLLGFVFGVTGFRGGVVAHWSHMLGVREEARNAGVGRMLKEYQQTALGALGVHRIYWTFDPLQSKNAYFNLNRLGATVDEYVPDMYGDTGSPLHLGLPTDRLIVHVAAVASDAPMSKSSSSARGPIMTPFPRSTDVIVDRDAAASPEMVLIEIPADVLAVSGRSLTEAQTWRLAVRDYFQWALGRGYTVAGVHRDRPTGRSFYMMVAPTA